MSHYTHHPQQQASALPPGHQPHPHPNTHPQQQAYGPSQGQYAPPPPYQPHVEYINQPPGQYAPPPVQQQQPTAQHAPQGPPPRPQPYPAMTGPRMLHIYTTGYSRRHMQILDSDKHTILYTIESHSFSKPQTKIFAGDSSNLIGTILFHSLSSKIDLQVHGIAITIDESGFFSSGYEYSSPAFGGGRLKWKEDGHFTSDLACVQQGSKEVVAKFLECEWAMKKEGKLELAPGVADGGPMMDEIVVAGLAIVEAKRSSSSAGGGGG